MGSFYLNTVAMIVACFCLTLCDGPPQQLQHAQERECAEARELQQQLAALPAAQTLRELSKRRFEVSRNESNITRYCK